MGNPPLWPLCQGTVDTDDILLIKVNPFKINNVPESVEEIKDRVNEISFNSSLAHEIKHLEFINKQIDAGVQLTGDIKRINLHCLSADNSLQDFNLSSKLNTSWDFLMHLKNLGYQACDNWIKINADKIGKQSTFQI
jgi:NTE family protein